MAVICYVDLAFYVILAINKQHVQFNLARLADELICYDGALFNSELYSVFDAKFDVNSLSVGVVISPSLHACKV